MGAHARTRRRRQASQRRRQASRRRLQAWLITGPLGHLAGGGLDFAGALIRYWRSRPARDGRPDAG